MDVKIIPVGYLQANCYILKNKNECIIIDPGDEKEKIIKAIGNSKLVAIITTHDHFDHVGALKALQEYYQVSTYNIENLEEKEYQFGPFQFEIIYTKGHADTCITIYFKKEEMMFTGDFLFKDSIGRVDLDTSNEMDMNESLEKIKKYSDAITIYPGHGESTNLGYEKKNNIFLR